MVQGVQSEGLPGRHRQILPATSEFDHAHSAAVRSEPDGRQREHGAPLLCFPFKLPRGETAAGHRWASHRHFWSLWNPASDLAKRILCAGLCETDNMNKAGYTPVMLAALTAADSHDDLEVAQQLLKLGNVDARSRQVITTLTPASPRPPEAGVWAECSISGPKLSTWIARRPLSVLILSHLPPESFHSNSLHFSLSLRRRARQRSCSQWATAVLPWWSCSLAAPRMWTCRTTRAPRRWCAPASTGTLTSWACCWRWAAATSASQTRCQFIARSFEMKWGIKI